MGRLRPAHFSNSPTRIWISTQLQMDSGHNQVQPEPAFNQPNLLLKYSPCIRTPYLAYHLKFRCGSHLWDGLADLHDCTENQNISFLLLYFMTRVFRHNITPRDHSPWRMHEATHVQPHISLGARVGFERIYP